MDTIVVGAGLAGLAAAQRLVEAGRQVTVHDLFASAGVTTTAARGKRWRRVRGGWENLEQLPAINRDLIRIICARATREQSLAESLQQHAPEPELEEARNLLTWYAEGFHAADPTRPVFAGAAGAHRELSRPVERTLFFAGEATCGSGLNGTMEGAVQSGRRAAAEVLDA